MARQNRIHIVGLGPRTGSTLLTEASIACFEIEEATSHEDRIFTKTRLPEGTYLTKANLDILIAQMFLEANPNLHIMCMMRDPRDAIVSKHRKTPDRYWAGLRYWKTYLPYWRQVKDHPRFLTIRYEDLVTDPDAVQKEIETHIPYLKRTAPFSRYHEVTKPSIKSMRALNGVRAISSKSVGNWRNHLPRVASQLQIHGSITDDLIEFGYEDDDSWLQALVNIQPDRSRSYWPERFTKLGILKYRFPGIRAIAAMRLRRWLTRDSAG